MHHQFTLQAYKGPATRHRCPACGKPKCFKLYINTETKEPLSPTTGKCDREIKCGYHQTPKQYFESTGTIYTPPINYKPVEQKLAAPVSLINKVILSESLTGYDTNRFILFLKTVFDETTINRLIQDYKIGSSKHWPGATVFWQIDTNHQIRTGKIMLYNPATGKRVREPHSHIAWVHSALKQSDYNLQQCLFGEHLLREHNSKPVALVESEKTALIASAYLPQYLWLATGSLQGLTAGRCKILSGKNVTLFPDLQGYDKWKQKAEELKHICNFSISTLLEGLATPQQKAAGWDIADYLVTRNHKEFLANTAYVIDNAEQEVNKSSADLKPKRQQKFWQAPVTVNRPNSISSDVKVSPAAVSQSGSAECRLCGKGKPGHCACTYRRVPEPGDSARESNVSWNIEALETFFATYTPPTGPICIDGYSTIITPAKFIDSHLAMVRANKNKRWFKPYYDRLVELMEWMGGLSQVMRLRNYP